MLDASQWENHVDTVDARCYLIVHRLFAIAKHKLASTNKVKLPKLMLGIKPVTLVELMHNLGHLLQPITSGRLKCSHCHQIWARTQLRQATIEAVQCPGLALWELSIGRSQRPTPLRLGNRLQIGQHLLHESHRLNYLRGYIYCRTCGSFTDGKRVVKLNGPCMKDGVKQHAVLRRFQLGQHPQGPTGVWPVLKIEKSQVQAHLDR